MSTKDPDTDTWPCGCGQGHLIYENETPDHPYNPRTTCTAVKIDCVDCDAKFEIRTDSFDVEGAPPPERGFEFRFFVDKQDVEARRRASRAVSTARARHDKIVLSLRNAAETKLAELSSNRRYAVLCEMFGFPNADAAKEFVARRHLSTVVNDAVSAVGRLEHLSQYFGRAEEFRQARDEMQEATAAAERLGRPPVRAISKRKVFSLSDFLPQ